MDEETYTRLIAGALSDELAPEEREQLERWLAEDPAHQEIYASYRSLWAMDDQAEEYQPDVAVGRKRFEAAMDAQNKPEPKVISMTPVQMVLRVAAVLVVGLLGYLGFRATQHSNRIELATATQEQQELVLPDGSTVWLNQNSTLSYTADFEERTIELVGEAYFEVERNPDRPFRVESRGAEVKVLGTKFNVRSYPAEQAVEVSVISGKVGVSTADEPGGLVLNPGDEAEWKRSDDGFVAVDEPGANALAWKNRQLIFDDVPLELLVKDLEAYFQVEIKIVDDAPRNCRLNGDFSDPKLEVIFEILENSLPINIQPTNGRYEIRGSACP